MKGTAPPKFSLVLPLLTTMCTEIQDLVNEVDEDWENEFILKDDGDGSGNIVEEEAADPSVREETPPEQTPPEPTPSEQTQPEQTPPEQTPPEQTPETEALEPSKTVSATR